MDSKKSKAPSNPALKIKFKNLFIFIVITALIVAAIVFIPRFKTETKLSKNKISVSMVDIGSVYQTIPATGEVAAKNEVLLLCPMSSIVQTIIKPAGSYVQKGEVILALDQTEIIRQIEELEDQLEMMRNNLYKSHLNARVTRIDLDHDIEVRKLKITSLKSQLSDQEALYEVGGISQAKIDKTKQELVLAEKELKRSKEKHSIKLQQLIAAEKGLELQISMKEKDLLEKNKVMDKMIIKSPGAGIVLEVRAREGEIVKHNALIIRLSEHTSFKIVGRIDDKQAEYIRNGQKAFAVIDNAILDGRIGNIRPEVEDDMIKFDIFLINDSHRNLRVNKKVELQVVKREKENVLRIKRGGYFANNRINNCYVLQNKEAIRTNVILGMKGFDYIEVKKGLDTNDIVINSNLSDIKPLNTLTIE